MKLSNEVANFIKPKNKITILKMLNAKNEHCENYELVGRKLKQNC